MYVLYAYQHLVFEAFCLKYIPYTKILKSNLKYFLGD